MKTVQDEPGIGPNKSKSARFQSMRRVVGLLGHIVLLTIASAGFVAIILVALATSSAEASSRRNERLNPWLRVDVSTTLTVIRILQALIATTTSIALVRTFLSLKWVFIQRPNGMSYRSLLALSPSTLDWGTIRIIVSSSESMLARFGGISRLSLTTFIWLAGIVFFFRTSLVTVYDAAHTFDATAGVGPFNASYVQPFLDRLQSSAPQYEFSIVPYTYYAVVYNLLSNTLWSTVVDPVNCQRSSANPDCEAYVLSGGMSKIMPWNPSGYPDHSVLRAESVPTVHLEFHGDNGDGITFEDEDCDVFGSNTTLIGAKFCVSQANATELHTGIFLCLNGTAGGSCKTTDSTPKMTTSLFFYTRQVTLTSFRSNLTISHISDLTPPQPISFSSDDLSNYRLALRWLLDFAAADIPAPSSIIETFWTAKTDLEDPFINSFLVTTFRSILTFPVYFFNANSFGNPDLKAKVITENLPRQFYTRASVAEPHVKIRFDTGMLLLFAVLQGCVLVVLWGVLGWMVVSAKEDVPVVSSFPLFDFGVKANSEGGAVFERREQVMKAGDSMILRMTKGVKVTATG